MPEQSPHEMPPKGSSPLARGIFEQRSSRSLRSRLIPAGAGHLRRNPRAEAATRAHPRWRGAYKLPPEFDYGEWGSSPLARGILVCQLLSPVLSRLIPAGAGHMQHPQPMWLLLRAHPRWRGAYATAASSATSAGGSSPLARGICLMICIYSKTVLILHLTQNKRHGYSYLTYRYLRRRRAVAHPLRGLLLVVLLSGRIMRVMPSKSVGIQS